MINPYAVRDDKRLLFQTMQEIYEGLTTAGALPDDLAKLGTHIQKSGKGDNTEVLTVACLFKFEAGDNWLDFCEFYTPQEEMTQYFERSTMAKLRGFWNRVSKKGIKKEAEALAEIKLRQVA